jgi:hypothetical protein
MFTLYYPNYPASTLFAQNLTDNSTRWTFDGDGQLDTAPLVLSGPAGEFVVEGSGSGMLYELDATSGRVIWSTNVGAAIALPDEQSSSQPLTGLGAGQGLLVVPAGNTLTAYLSDSTPPTISAPRAVTASATSAAGALITYAVSATDSDDAAAVNCSPASGSSFPVGTNIVNCTATDTAGNTASATFPVVVSSPNADCKLSDYPTSKGVLVLKNANLSGCYLPGSNLSGANATNANLSGSYLDNANLSATTLNQAQLQHAVLTRADLSSSKLNFANLTGASLSGANLTGASWSQTSCPDGTNSNDDGNTCTGHLG